MVVGIGLNYKDHAAETGAAIPEEPVVFLKASSTLVGPYDEIRLPPGSRATDYEVELAVVVGTTLRQCRTADEALAAYEQALRLDGQVLAKELRELLGVRLVAYLTGVSETRAVHQWAEGSRHPREETVERLRAFGERLAAEGLAPEGEGLDDEPADGAAPA